MVSATEVDRLSRWTAKARASAGREALSSGDIRDGDTSSHRNSLGFGALAVRVKNSPHRRRIPTTNRCPRRALGLAVASAPHGPSPEVVRSGRRRTETSPKDDNHGSRFAQNVYEADRLGVPEEPTDVPRSGPAKIDGPHPLMKGLLWLESWAGFVFPRWVRLPELVTLGIGLIAGSWLIWDLVISWLRAISIIRRQS